MTNAAIDTAPKSTTRRSLRPDDEACAEFGLFCVGSVELVEVVVPGDDPSGVPLLPGLVGVVDELPDEPIEELLGAIAVFDCSAS